MKDVEWSNSHHSSILIKKKRVHGTSLQSNITGLDLGTTYVVKIQAILVKRDKRIRGRWMKIYLKTPPLSVAAGKLINIGFIFADIRFDTLFV